MSSKWRRLPLTSDDLLTASSLIPAVVGRRSLAGLFDVTCEEDYWEAAMWHDMMSETALRTAQSNLGTVTLYCGQTERSCQDLKRQKLSHDSVILMPET